MIRFEDRVNRFFSNRLADACLNRERKWSRGFVVNFAVTFSASILLLASPALALQGNGNGGGNGGGGFVQVEAVFADFIDPGNPDNDDRIMSDGSGPYTSDKKEKTEVVIQGNSGNFNLDTGRVRKVYLNFSDWIPEHGGNPSLTPPEGNYGADIRTHEEYRDVSGDWVSYGPLNLLGMDPGTFTHVGFTNGPRLNFYPDAPVADCSLSDPVKVTRSLDGNSWIFESLPDGKACSYRIVDGNWNDPQFAGYFQLPFQMTVTKQ